MTGGIFAGSLLAVLLLIGNGGVQCKKIIKIGGIFDVERRTDSNVVALHKAINDFNVANNKIALDSSVKWITSNKMESYSIGKEVCELLSKNMATILYPDNNEGSPIAQSICDTFDIPIIHTEDMPDSEMSINFHPRGSDVNSVLANIVKELKWEKFTVLYDDEEKMIEFISNQAFDFVPKMLKLQAKNTDWDRVANDENFLLMCKSEYVVHYLQQAYEKHLTNKEHTYLITSMDAHTLDMTEFENELFQVVTMSMANTHDLSLANGTTQLRDLLLIDALNHLSASIVKSDQEINLRPGAFSCKVNTSTGWNQGRKLKSKIGQHTSNGLTGFIVFDENGRREKISFDIFELVEGTWKRTGTTLEDHSVEWSEDDTHELATLDGSKTIVVSSRLGAPFLMEVPLKDNATLDGNDRFEGYVKDLMDKIAEMLNVTYEIRLTSDNMYGGFDKKTNKWTGIMGDVIKKRADIGVADLTITSQREAFVDFSMPFMSFGIGILFSKPMYAPTDTFKFLAPFAPSVWIMIVVAYIVISALICIYGRMSSKERIEVPINEDITRIKSRLTLCNSLWLSLSGYMQQGSNHMPKAHSTRLMTALWWFFAFIMVSSYTGQLIVYTMYYHVRPADISSIEELIHQGNIKYGLIEGGSTNQFFQGSDYDVYKYAWRTMKDAKPSVMTRSNAEGIERVLAQRGQYAFFMESTTIDYIVNKDCRLTQIGGLLNSRSYGIALPQNSPYRKIINKAILSLSHDGELFKIKEKWWKMDGDPECFEVEEKNYNTIELGMDHFGGLFLILIFGAILSLLVAILEFMWHARNISNQKKIPFGEALSFEMSRCKGKKETQL